VAFFAAVMTDSVLHWTLVKRVWLYPTEGTASWLFALLFLFAFAMSGGLCAPTLAVLADSSCYLI
jgi:hypothetical protein